MYENRRGMYRLKMLLGEVRESRGLVSRAYNILVKGGIDSVEALAETNPYDLEGLLARTKGAGEGVLRVVWAAKNKADKIPGTVGKKYGFGDVVEYDLKEEDAVIRYLVYGYLSEIRQYQVLRVIRSPGFDGQISHDCMDAEFIEKNGRLIGHADLSALVYGMDILHGLEASG